MNSLVGERLVAWSSPWPSLVKGISSDCLVRPAAPLAPPELEPSLAPSTAGVALLGFSLGWLVVPPTALEG